MKLLSTLYRYAHIALPHWKTEKVNKILTTETTAKIAKTIHPFWFVSHSLPLFGRVLAFVRYIEATSFPGLFPFELGRDVFPYIFTKHHPDILISILDEIVGSILPTNAPHYL